MYVEHWGLLTKPFEPALEADTFVYQSESFSGAFSKLRYAIDEGRAMAALAGPSGVGKTLLVRWLAESLNAERRPVTHLVFPQMSHRDLVAYLAAKLAGDEGDEPSTGSVDESVRRLEAIAEQNLEHDRTPLVVIDEAQVLEDSGALETLRLMSNFGKADKPAFTVLLVGQMGLLSSVARQPTLDERLAVKTLLRGFSAEETAEYLDHRLAAAGGAPGIFTRDAIQKLHAHTDGVARRINRLADLALVVGFAERADQIGADQIDSIHHELIAVGG